MSTGTSEAVRFVVRRGRRRWTPALAAAIGRAWDRAQREGARERRERAQARRRARRERAGEGCDDLRVMESLATSKRSSRSRPSKFGIGGVMRQFYASRGGVVDAPDDADA